MEFHAGSYPHLEFRKGPHARTDAHIDLDAEGPRCGVGQMTHRTWTIDEIVNGLLTSPRAQFNIYTRDDVIPSQQRELVAYRTNRCRGGVRRSELSRSAGTTIPANLLGEMLVSDIMKHSKMYFTFFAMPTFGMEQFSEDKQYLDNYQQIFPIPLADIDFH